VNGTSATLSYDGLDHLTSWNAGNTGQEQYVYDAGGERVLLRSTSAGSTSMTVYAFGLEEHDYSGSGVSQGNTYYYSLGGLLIGEFDGTNTNMYLTDALGSVITTISSAAGSAAVQGNQVYGPYGTSRYQQGSMDTTKGFTGQYTDSLSGLDYYNARYYDPVVGRFLSADPVEGNLLGMDPYAYVGGNPETASDPSGQAYKPISEGGLAEELLEAEELEGGGDGTGGPGVGPNTPGPDLTVTNGNVTTTLNTNTDSITQETVSADGTTWTDLQPGTTAYEDALNRIDEAYSPPEPVNSLTPRPGEPSTEAPTPPPASDETSSTGGQTPPASGETSSGAGGQTPPTVPETESAAGNLQPPGKTLFHYTSEQGMAGILQSKTLNPSTKPPFITYGVGQYLTDIAPEQIIGRVRADLTQAEIDQGYMSFSQLSRQIYGQPFGMASRLRIYFEMNVSGLSVENPARNIFLIRGTEPLDLFGRIIRFGATPWAP